MKRNKLEEIAKILAEKEEETVNPQKGLLDKINDIDLKLSKLERIFGSVETEIKEEKPLNKIEDLAQGIANLRK